jgi:hypothetical protein
MKRIYCTFGGKAYDSTLEHVAKYALDYGVDEVRIYDDRWLLSTTFYQLNKWLFEREPQAGFGWYVWKAFIVLQEFKRLNDGDIVLYVDADTYPIANLSILFEFARRDGIVLFEAQGCGNNRFTRSDCWFAMGQKMPALIDTQHGCGRFQLFRVGDWRAEQFLMEWLVYMLNPNCQGHEGSKTLKDHENFARHSADQSVLTLLGLKYGIPFHREACQYGFPVQPNCGLPEDTYEQLFHQVWCEGDRSDTSGSRFRNV